MRAQGTLREHSGSTQGALREHSGSTQGRLREGSRSAPGPSEAIETLDLDHVIQI